MLGFIQPLLAVQVETAGSGEGRLEVRKPFALELVCLFEPETGEIHVIRSGGWGPVCFSNSTSFISVRAMALIRPS